MAVALKNCLSCGVPVRWVFTDRGNWMPLDPDMCPDGNFVFSDPEGELGRVRALSRTERDGEATRPRYKSHFATCPQSSKWRRGAAQKALARTRARVERSS